MIFLGQLINEACQVFSKVVVSEEKLPEKKQQFVNVFTQIVDLVRPSAYFPSFDLAFLTQKTLGDFYMEFKDLTEALKVYKTLKILCEDFEKYREKLFVYEQIGYTLRMMKKHDQAVSTYKKMLQLSWKEKD